MNKPDIRKLLILSTSHLSKEAAIALDSKKDKTFEPIEFGYFGWTQEDYQGNVTFPEFEEIYKFAEKHGCHYIKFDCDGFEYDELKTFDW